MIKEGDVLIWNGYGYTTDTRYLVVKIMDYYYDVPNIVQLRLIVTDAEYYEPLKTIIQGLEEGWITMEKEPIIPRRVIKSHMI
jgi:hypothetical protein